MKQKDAPYELTICNPAPACTRWNAQHDMIELTFQVSEQICCGCDGCVFNNLVTGTLNIIADLDFNYSSRILGSRDGNSGDSSPFIGFHGKLAVGAGVVTLP